MKKVIDFQQAKKRIISKRKQESRKEWTIKSVVAVVLAIILIISFLSTYSLAVNGNLGFMNMKTGMGPL